MYQPLSLYIGLRYTRAKRRNQFISFVSLISLLGMVLGVAALIVVLSVMNGFEGELRDRILAVVPHGFLDGPDNQLKDWQLTIDKLHATDTTVQAAPYVDDNVMLSRPSIIRGAQLNAIDPDYEKQVSIIDSSMQQGSLNDLAAGEYNIIIGNILARVMGVYIGDEITIILPRVTVTPFGLFPRVKRFTVTGVFAVGAELDSTTVFIHLQDGQKLFQMGSAVKGLRVEFDSIFSAEKSLPELLSLMPEGSTSRSWKETQGSLFQAVEMEKTMISLLLFIIVAIAAFNIVSILTMMVADKRSDIAVLRTMGASPGSIMSIFMIQGISVGVLGIGVGLLIGVPVATNVGAIVIWLESLMGAQVFNPDVYFISRIPSVLESGDIYLIVVVGLVLSALATIYPSYRAAKVQPAEALRYE